MGRDSNFLQTDPNLRSAIEFNRQRPRQTFHKFDGYMVKQAHENRFELFNDTPQVCGKFKRPRVPNFTKQVNLGMEVTQNASSTVKENAFHMEYEITSDLTQPRTTVGMHDWKKQISSFDCHIQPYGNMETPLPYDKDRVFSGFNFTQKPSRFGVPF